MKINNLKQKHGEIMKYIKDEMIKPVLIGGVIGGVLSSIPIIACLNCCGLLYIFSGAITAHLITEKFDPTDRDYIIAGGLSGTVAGVINCLLNTLISFHIFIFGAIVPFIIEHHPRELYIELSQTVATSMIFHVLYIAIYMAIGAIFGAVGGIIYEKLKESKHSF